MNTTTIIIIVAVVALIAVLAVRGGGPRVTQIDRTVRRDEGDSE
jgi:hypothetical protein